MSHHLMLSRQVKTSYHLRINSPQEFILKMTLVSRLISVSLGLISILRQLRFFEVWATLKGSVISPGNVSLMTPRNPDGRSFTRGIVEDSQIPSRHETLEF